MTFDLEGFGDAVDDALSKRARLRGPLHVGLEDDEFVAAEPRHRVDLARAGLQAPCDRFQERIADRMAERVVDRLEVIEVEAKNRQAFAAADPRQAVLGFLAQHYRFGKPVRASCAAM